jgi:trigger factor
MGILRKKYGPSVLSEVVEGAVSDGTEQAIKDHALRPALQPKVEITSFSEGGDLEFTIAVEILPEVEVADLTQIALERPVIEVGDEQVADALNRIAHGQERTEPHAEGTAAAQGDVVVIDFEGRVGGKIFPGGAAKDFSLKLGSNMFVPGFEDQLIGAKVGDSKVVAVTFPADYGKTELNGQDAEFDVTVRDVRRPVATEVNDDLAKAVGLDDLATLKDQVRADIAEQYAGLSRDQVKRRLMDALADLHSFAVPEGMVTVEFDAIWAQVERDKAEGRQDPEDAAKDDEVLKAEYRAIAERRVRLGLVLSEVGRRNNVTVGQDDLNRALIAQARSYPGQEQAIISYYQKHPDALNALRAPIFEEKVVDFIIGQAKVTDKPVSLAALTADEGAVEAAAEPAAKPKKASRKKAEAVAETAAAPAADTATAEEAAKPKRAPRKKKDVEE